MSFFGPISKGVYGLFSLLKRNMRTESIWFDWWWYRYVSTDMHTVYIAMLQPQVRNSFVQWLVIEWNFDRSANSICFWKTMMSCNYSGYSYNIRSLSDLSRFCHNPWTLESTVECIKWKAFFRSSAFWVQQSWYSILSTKKFFERMPYNSCIHLLLNKAIIEKRLLFWIESKKL